MAFEAVVRSSYLVELLEELHRTIHEEGLSPADLVSLGYTVSRRPDFSTIGEAWTAGLLVGRVRALSYAHLKVCEAVDLHSIEVEVDS